MLLVFVSWLYIFITATIWGNVANYFLDLKNNDLVISQFLGLFFITLFTTGVAFFHPINGVFQLFFTGITIGLACWRLKSFNVQLQNFAQYFLQLSRFFKIIFIVLGLAILAQTSSLPFVIDNESYYLQTIKWLNEYGFVKGLGNLHLFLAQNSGWHVLQSAFNFSFLTSRLNDLSAYALLLANFYAFYKLDEYFKDRQNRISNIYLAAIPLGSVLFFQFISAPSPDLPVFVISILLFHLLIEKWNYINPNDFKNSCLLCFFILLIKLSTVFVVFIPIILLIFHFKKVRKTLPSLLFLGFLTFILIISKNQVLTGFPLFPLRNFAFITSDYQIPDAYQKFFFEVNKIYAYRLEINDYESLSYLERFMTWLTLPKLHGFFNKAIILLLLVFPFCIFKSKFRKPFFFIYGLAILQLIILFLTSPQYRFFLIFIIILSAIIFFQFLQQKKIIQSLLILSLGITIVSVFSPINLNSFTNNKYLQADSNFILENTVVPKSNSKYNYIYEVEKIGNLKYNNPTNVDFFWITGDGDLPSVRKLQLEYFKERLHYIPQLRTGNLKDGFYSKPVEVDLYE